MKAISVVPIVTIAGEVKQVRATIVADAVPSPLPTNGADVEGMAADMTFAPLSTIIVPSADGMKVFITNESGEFVAV